VTVARSLNLALRFLLELAMLAALAYWGSQTGTGAVSILLAIVAPCAAALVWGIAVSPKARLQVPLRLRVVIELVLFGLAVAALVSAGQPGLAWAGAACVVVSELVLYMASPGQGERV
jgi:peptidoglycan/LPS O-acetylase OafA/YrhL